MPDDAEALRAIGNGALLQFCCSAADIDKVMHTKGDLLLEENDPLFMILANVCKIEKFASSSDEDCPSSTVYYLDKANVAVLRAKLQGLPIVTEEVCQHCFHITEPLRSWQGMPCQVARGLREQTSCGRQLLPNPMPHAISLCARDLSLPL